MERSDGYRQQIQYAVVADSRIELKRLLSSLDRRSAARFLANTPISVSTAGATASPRTGTMIDFSRTGLGIEVETHLPDGSELLIGWGSSYLLGSVCYCRETKQGTFRVGVILEPLPANRSGIAAMTREVFGIEAQRPV